jgi:hypothetical protein
MLYTSEEEADGSLGLHTRGGHDAFSATQPMTADVSVADAGGDIMQLQCPLLLLLALLVTLRVIHSILVASCIPECICLSQTQVLPSGACLKCMPHPCHQAC